MNRKAVLFMPLIGLVLSLGVGIQSATAQTPKHPQSATSAAQKTRGDANAKDENIKHDQTPNDPNAKVEAPPDKGGPKTRGMACHLHVDNRTPWYIYIYTDGDYRGEVSPYGDLVGYVGCGDTTVYGRATFTDGSVKTWGPTVYYIDGPFTWHLTAD